MKPTNVTLAASLLALATKLALAGPVGTAFTWQGQIHDSGQPATGTYDLRFTLFDAAGGGTALGTNTPPAAAISNGLYTATLDFGAAVFDGNARWLNISVKTNGAGSYTTLVPRQQLTPTPYAVYAPNAGAAASANSVAAANITGTLALGQLPAAVVTNSATGVVLGGSFSGNGSGLSALSANSLATGALSDARLSPNVPLLNANQTFTGQSSFSQNVGIGTSSPGKRLTVAGDMEVGTSAGDYHHLRVGGGNASGYLYGSFPGLGDGLSLGYNYYYDGAGTGRCDNTNGSTSRLTVSYGSITLATGAANAAPSPRLLVNYAGNVGIGTLYPRTALEVNGTVLATGFTGNFAGDGTALTNVVGSIPWQVVAGTSQQAQPNAGYMLSNAAQVTLTLPASPTVGDIVRVSAIGNGPWRVAQNLGQSVRLGSAAAPDIGVTWTSRATSQDWRSVASSADGARIVAATLSGNLCASADAGVTWTVFPTREPWQSVASSADGTRLIAAAQNGYLWTSTNAGGDWNPGTNNQWWEAVASSADGTKLVAAGSPGALWTSTDAGVTWTNRASSQDWRSVASSADGTKLVAAASGGALWTSADGGVTWTNRASSQNWRSVAASADGTKLVAAVYGGTLWTSTDSGVTWTSRATNRNWNSVASSADGSKLVATVFLGTVWTSTDSGVTWTSRAGSKGWSAVAASADGIKLVASVQGGYLWTSSPALGPTLSTTVGPAGYLAGSQDAAIELQYAGNGLWKPLSHEGSIYAY